MNKTNIGRIKCQSCQELGQLIGTKDRLKGRLLINPATSICYLCEKEGGLPPIMANLGEGNEQGQKWEKGGGKT